MRRSLNGKLIQGRYSTRRPPTSSHVSRAVPTSLARSNSTPPAVICHSGAPGSHVVYVTSDAVSRSSAVAVIAAALPWPCSSSSTNVADSLTVTMSLSISTRALSPLTNMPSSQNRTSPLASMISSAEV